MRRSRRIKRERRQLIGVEEAVEGGREGGEEAVEDLGEGGGEVGGEVFRTSEGCLARLVVQVGFKLKQTACQSS